MVCFVIILYTMSLHIFHYVTLIAHGYGRLNHAHLGIKLGFANSCDQPERILSLSLSLSSGFINKTNGENTVTWITL